jgi:CAAX amino terminal protease family.
LVVAITLPILIFTLIYLTLKVGGYKLLEQWIISYQSIPFLLIFFFLGAIGEEIGYMGYAVDPLQEKFNAFWTSIIIGIPWAVWHYPSIIQQGHNFNWILWGTLGTVAFRVLFVWIFNNTNHSLFACILPHCLYNTGRVLFPSDITTKPLVEYPEIHYSVIAVIAIVVTLLWRPQTLSNFILKTKTTNR